jgi:protein-tyrosine phosphatase
VVLGALFVGAAAVGLAVEWLTGGQVSSSLAGFFVRGEPNYSLVEDGLYQGGYVKAPPFGAQAVLNLCETEDLYRAEVHDWVPIPDASPAPDLDWLRRRVEFVDAQRRAGRTVYVHCWAGVSRSGMVVTAYLMFEHRWTREEALAFVRSRRPVTRPNPAFMELLGEWEQALRDRERPPVNRDR